MSVNSVHQNIEALEGWKKQLKGKKPKSDKKKNKYNNKK